MEDEDDFNDIPEFVRRPIHGEPIIEDNLPIFVLFTIFLIFFLLGFGVFYLIVWADQPFIMDIPPCDTPSCSSSASSHS